jgi:GMP synthase (glutamine-hydrolysing)
MLLILDFGSQFTQLIARRVREAKIYCEILPHDATDAQVQAHNPQAVILSGGPNSVYEPDAPTLPAWVLASGVPVLGICYGMQLLAHELGGKVQAVAHREYGRAVLNAPQTGLFANVPTPIWEVWMSHGDQVTAVPPDFTVLASSPTCAIAAMAKPSQGIYGLQFHPEVEHSQFGRVVLENFLTMTSLPRTWTPDLILHHAIESIRQQVGDAHVIAAVSGGVDSTVATALVHRAIGAQLTCFYVDTGLMRAGETEQVLQLFRDNLHANFQAIDATETFLSALTDQTDPETKRRIIGNLFIRQFEQAARQLGKDARFLVQGTIYPDVVESSGKGREKAAKIKTHHNVGGLPDDLQFDLIEPLRMLFKDEVRAVGTALGLPDEMVWRQPFPGPGLGIRCLGPITWERLETLRAADKILRDELAHADLLRQGTAQAFAVLLPVKSVGVMGDGRTYEEVVALRAVTTNDFMTADWARLPYDLLAKISNRICNEVRGVNRVVYDISSKPPATIEWE